MAGRRGPYWFQVEGTFDGRRWVPHGPMPAFFELPGPVNFHVRADVAAAEFPAIIERWERDRWPRLSRSIRRLYAEPRRRRTKPFRDELWSRLEVIADFDPAVFRLDVYGNVVARGAEQFSQAAFNTDHVFPFSKGGLTQAPNLRIIGQRANIAVKRARLEPTIVRADMQVGLSLERFLAGAEDQDFLDEILVRDRGIATDLADAVNDWDQEEARAELTCDFCLARRATQVCTGCAAYQYCSSECAQADWVVSRRHCK
jgi:hypothetical protein